jgi:hypothetical protein
MNELTLSSQARQANGSGGLRTGLLLATTFAYALVVISAVVVWNRIAVFGIFGCDVDRIDEGAGIGHALAVAVLVSIAGLIAAVTVSRSYTAFAFVSLLGATAIVSAIVAIDSTTWKVAETCNDFFGDNYPSTDMARFGYLRWLWGLAALVLAVNAVASWRGRRPERA